MSCIDNIDERKNMLPRVNCLPAAVAVLVEAKKHAPCALCLRCIGMKIAVLPRFALHAGRVAAAARASHAARPRAGAVG